MSPSTTHPQPASGAVLSRESYASEPGAACFVWSLWAVMLLAAIGFVAAFGADFPLSEDFIYVPILVGEEPITVDWLWSWANEFRFPLTKLILIAAFKATHLNFRAGLYLNVASLGLLAFGMIAAARRARGGTRYTDAFFPIACLHWGHHSGFLWNSVLVFDFAAALVGGMLLLIVGRGRPSLPAAWTAAAGLSLLPLCGPVGMAFLPALTLWVWSVAASSWRSGGRPGRIRGGLLLALTAPALALATLYFRGYQRPATNSPPGELGDVVRTTAQFLSLGFGPAAASLWPYIAWVVPGLLAVAAAFLVGAWARRPEERPRALGLLAFLAGSATLALGLGWGRSGMGGLAGFQDRYSALPVPMLCGVYFAVELYAGPAARRALQMGMLLAATAMLWGNTLPALGHGREVAARAASLHRDLRAGLPTYMIIGRHTPFLHPSQDAVARPLAMLRKAGVAPFRSLKEDPPFAETAVPLRPAGVSQIRWEGGTATADGVDPWITFTVPRPRYVAAIRIRYSHSNATATCSHFKISWKRPDQAGFPIGQEYANWGLPTGAGRETTVWVRETLGDFRIQPDNQPCHFRILGISLLSPELPTGR